AGDLHRRPRRWADDARREERSLVPPGKAATRHGAWFLLHGEWRAHWWLDRCASVRSRFVSQARRATGHVVGKNHPHQQDLRWHAEQLLDLCARAVRQERSRGAHGLAGWPEPDPARRRIA